MKESNLRK